MQVVVALMETVQVAVVSAEEARVVADKENWVDKTEKQMATKWMEAKVVGKVEEEREKAILRWRQRRCEGG